MTPSKFAPGTALQISLKTPGFSFRSESDCRFNFPRPVFRSVWALPAIVFSQSRSEIGCDAAIVYLVVYLADEYVNIIEAVHRQRMNPDHEQTRLACQAVALERRHKWRLIRPPSFHFGVAAFALRSAPSEGWRRGELNPVSPKCLANGRRFHRK